MAYEHTNKKGTKYYLHSKDVKLRGSGKLQTIYFFSKVPGEGAMDNLPAGYIIVENERTGLPTLKRANK